MNKTKKKPKKTSILTKDNSSRPSEIIPGMHVGLTDKKRSINVIHITERRNTTTQVKFIRQSSLIHDKNSHKTTNKKGTSLPDKEHL